MHLVGERRGVLGQVETQGQGRTFSCLWLMLSDFQKLSLEVRLSCLA